MKQVAKILLSFVFLIFIGYLLLPNPEFPSPPADSVQSAEPADTETPWRRAYFTNFTREEVILHYQRRLERSPLLGIPLPTIRLNYPPEDARTLIRDQTRSTFLEEIVHPFHESLFVNGFKPSLAKDAIEYKGRPFEQKITVKYIPSSVPTRISLALLSFVAFWFLTREWLDAAGALIKEWLTSQ